MLAALSSIRFRLTLWFMVALALLMFAVSVVVYFGLQRTLIENVDATLREAARRALTEAESQPSTARSQQDQLRRIALLSAAPTRLLSFKGEVLTSDPTFPAIDVALQNLTAATTGNARLETIAVGTSEYRLYTAPVKAKESGVRIAVVQVAQSLERENTTLADLRRLFAVLFPIALLAAALGGLFLASRALAPMERVRRNVEGIVAGRVDQPDLTQRVGRNVAGDEIGRLANTFDGLLERVQQAMSRERQFTADASHELRSPLTVLKGELSVALSRERTAEEYRDTLAQLEASVDEMSLLVEDLLTLARTNSSRASAAQVYERIDLVKLVSQVCERLQVIADSKEMQLTLPESSTPVVVLGNKLKLQRVITNLLDNALRYTPEGGQVWARAFVDGAVAHIEIEDTGIGIPPEHLLRVFDRFYRTDAARARENGGTGLGLAIAQAIVRSHSGEIGVTSQVGKGTCFKVTLPMRG